MMTDSHPATVRLLREATEWRLLSLLFSCPDPQWNEQLGALAAATAAPQLQQAATLAGTEGSPELYHTIFGPGGPAAPREVSYQQTALSGRFLAELFDFYAAFAYTSPTGEPPDHIATEADFVGYLRLKEAYALSREDSEQAAITTRAAEQFLTEHVARIAEPLARALDVSDVPYLALAGAALLQRVGPAPQAGFPDAIENQLLTPLDVCDAIGGCTCTESSPPD